jgi:hypothetical protein
MKANWKFRAVRFVNAAGYASGFWVKRQANVDLVGTDADALAFAAKTAAFFSARRQSVVRVEARTAGEVDFSVPDQVRPRFVYQVTPRSNKREWQLSAGMVTGWFPTQELAIEGAASLARDKVVEIRVNGASGLEFVVLIDGSAQGSRRMPAPDRATLKSVRGASELVPPPGIEPGSTV